MMNNCVEIALDVLESIHYKLPEAELFDSSLLRELKRNLQLLKVQLRFLRTFFMCGGKWGKGVNKCASTLISIEDTVQKHSLEIQYICLRLRSDDDDYDDRVKFDIINWGYLHKVVSKFLACFDLSYWQEMEQLYWIFSDDSLLTSSSPDEVELLELMDSLLHNMRDFLRYRKHCCDDVRKLEENVRFLKNLILFAMFQGLQHGQLEDLLIHIQGLVVRAARLVSMSWYCFFVSPSICLLINRIQPVESHVCEIYVGVLRASRLSRVLQPSHNPGPRSHKLLLGDFVDSLLVLLQELLSVGNSYRDAFICHTPKLHAGLMLLRTILREHSNKFDELYEKMHALLAVVISQSGIAICHLFVKLNKGSLVKRLKLLFLYLEEKFQLFEAEVDMKTNSLRFGSYFPRTNLVGFINSVLEKVHLGLLTVTSVKEKLQTIHKDLLYLRSFLIDFNGEDGKLQRLRNRIAAVAYETEFVMDSSAFGDPLHNSFSLLSTITKEIQNIKAEASGTFYSKRQITTVAKIAKTYSKMPLTGEIPIFNKFIAGFDDEAQIIINRLTRGTKQLDIVAIVGMPGLGKTTLAQKVYIDPAITFHFHVRSWCFVSQIYEHKSMLHEILSGLDSNFADIYLEMNVNDLAHKLYQYLKGKRYLIVLDDVWDFAAWKGLGNAFPNDANGSRILLTSRRQDMASQIKPNSKPHNLRSLNNDESWELLKKICFKESSPPNLIARGKAIAGLCKGLPLMIRIVAGLLSNTEQLALNEVFESLMKGTPPAIDQCKKTLELSYHHLPDYLKPCFLYLRIFKEEKQIPLQKLFWLWIAEGFVEKTDRVCLEDVANDYMTELIQRNLVMVATKGPTGQIKSCVLHDLLWEFCAEKCKEEQFLHCLPNHRVETCNESSYRLQVYPRVEKYVNSRKLFPHLRSLFFVGDHPNRFLEHVHGYAIFYEFCRSKLLRVLDLSRIYLHAFPGVILLLIHLRYLALAAEGKELSIPSSINSLLNLETFLLEGSMAHISLPGTMWNMQNLRHVYVTAALAHLKLPKENPEHYTKLENLQTLSTIHFSCGHKMIEAVRKFPNLRKLKCYLGIATSCPGDCKILDIEFMNQLESLSIFQSFEKFHYSHFQFPLNLKKLLLSNFCLPWSDISAIDELPNLEVLKIVNNAFTGENWDMEEGKFTKLRFLKLAYLDLAWWTASDINFPQLEKLGLQTCWNLKEIPLCLACISTLQMIEVSNCASAASSIKKIQEEQIARGNEDLKIVIPTLEESQPLWFV